MLRLLRWTLPLALLGALALPSQQADAFCGFYVSGATGDLFNNATQVVLMRDGMRTVLSMQNSYQGPPSDFAMVIPVPVVLQKENVKTLAPDVFQKIDQMAAPRLVEYWEQDPCWVEPPMPPMAEMEGAVFADGAPVEESPKGLGVKIEAQFKVGEYEIVILSAQDSTGLDKWLKLNKYNIPAGAEPLLRPYVEAGTKFFVAKVDSTKVKFNGDKAVLSPLRFHYDTQEFSLPVRLGLINASGPQDLIVHILAKNQRYEVANYKNAFIPTNLKVDDPVKDRFGEFYAALFDETLKQNPGAVITEYSWAAGTCDPCPGPTIDQNDIATFGGDVIPGADPWQMVLTRLHARYTKDTVGEDLVFKAAPAVVGGRGTPNNKGDFDEKGAKPDSYANNFQGRYAVLHRWEGKVECQTPVWGRWGGPPNGGANQTQAAKDLANAPRGGVQLTNFVRQDVPEIGVKAANPLPPTDVAPGKAVAPVMGNAPDAGVAQAPDAGAVAPVADAGAPVAQVADAGTPAAPAESGESPKSGGCSQVGGPRGGWALGALLWGLVALRRRRA